MPGAVGVALPRKGGWLTRLEEIAGRRFIPITLASFLLFLALHLLYISFCPYNYDEGKYLYASRLVMEGKLLYRDTFFHHFPLMPYVYGAILHLIGGGIYGARLISVAFSAAAFLAMLAVARRVSGHLGAVSYAILLSLSFYGIAQLTRAKTYPLPAFFLAMAFFLLFCWKAPKTSRYTGAMLMATFAAASRISLLPLLIVTFVYALWVEREDPRLKRRLSLVFSICLLLLFSYAFLVPVKIFFYDTLLWNPSHFKEVGLWRYLKWQWWVFRGILFFRLMPMALLLTAFFFVFLRDRRRLREKLAPGQPLTFISLATGALFFAQFFLGYIYEEYQAFLIPAIALLAGDGFKELYERWLREGALRRIAALMGIVLATALYSGIRYGFLKPESFAPEPALERFYRQAEVIARHTSPGDPNIITFDPVPTYLANRTVAHGFEYEWWSFWPEASDEEALRYNTINAGMVRRLILGRRSEAIQAEFLRTFLPKHDPDGSIARFVKANYQEEDGYYFLKGR